MLASRAPVVAELLIASVATVLVATSPPSPKPVHRQRLHVVHVELASPLSPVRHGCGVTGELATMYRDHEFGAVALALDSCRDADLMRALDGAYQIASASDADLSDRFVAVREAYRIDLAFGGAHSNELADAEKMIAARYANQLLRTHDVDEAQRVANIAAALR
ncbi:MAG TPA: hypothetical protein VGG28_14230 [Kofleriaceae bacterium]|jgi:hypothetical protein